METSRSRTPAVTASLWLFFLAGAATNTIGQFTGLDETYRLVAGGVAAVCLVLLLVRFLARRKD
ncbi:hypothetical protein [Amycolatopsis silviterrae]|uniref:DUF2631 domain-containing protein n=1 Tax=Amycolatopsis silviterrae TaxID=1656914 RepID=A0ABW5GZP4_9PSEU